MPDQPNILFFMCDQLTPLVLSPYQKNMAITPTFQRIADEGVTFTSAYCNSPLCNPSRASMMSGRYCSELGTYHNASALHVDQPCFTHYLREAGYHTILSGKMHFNGPDQLHGFNQRLTTDIYPGEMDWVPDWSSKGKEASGNKLHAIYQATAPLDGDKFQAYDERATFQAQQWMQHYARSQKMREDPFFLCVSLTNPHSPYVAPEKMWDLYEGRKIPAPRVGPRKPDNHNARWLWDALELDNGAVPPEQTQLARRGYFACTSFVDQQLSKIIQTMEEMDLDDNTWIILASDHGDMIGERGLWLKKLFYENSSRVPLIIRKPKKHINKEAGQKRNQPVSLLDMLPTFADIGNTRKVDESLPGRSLVPVLDNPDALSDGHCIMEYMGESVRGSMRMVRQGSYKYVLISPVDEPSVHEELLFCLDDDPDELNNLAGDSTYTETLNRLRGICIADGWDGQRVNQEVIADQQRGLFLRAALRNKPSKPFTYVPPPVNPHNPEQFGLHLNDPRRP